MKLSNASLYAIRALAYLGKHGKQGLTTSHRIARECRLPELFLLKVLKPLAAVGILRSTRGPNGGYRLARPAQKVSLLEIVEAVEGPIGSSRAGVNESGDRSLNRRLDRFCAQADEKVRGVLRGVRLSELITKS